MENKESFKEILWDSRNLGVLNAKWKSNLKQIRKACLQKYEQRTGDAIDGKLSLLKLLKVQPKYKYRGKKINVLAMGF